jgi:hypothetical protein
MLSGAIVEVPERPIRFWRTKVGLFYSVRGWVEMDEVQCEKLRNLVLNEVDELLVHYNASWHFPTRGGGYSRFAFFGGTVRDCDLPAITQQLKRIGIEVTSYDNDLVDFVEGLFCATHEDGSHELMWRLNQGKFTEQLCELGMRSD